MLAKERLRDLRTRYQIERPLYAKVSSVVADRLRHISRVAGISAYCTGRAKEMDSLIKKAIERNYPNDPYASIHDKAGARILITYEDDISEIRDHVENHFQVIHVEDKSKQLRANPAKLGYLGVHYEVRIEADTRVMDGQQEYDLSGLICEIQIQTRAQNLWNDVSHVHLYKPIGNPNLETQHRIYRMVALMELFDDQLGRARNDIYSQEGYESAVIFLELEKQYFRLTAEPFSSDLSFEIIDSMKSLFNDDERTRFPQLLEEFLVANGEKVEALYRDNENATERSPLLFQPESLLLFERLEHDRFATRDLWNENFPDYLLEEIAALWQIRISGTL